jgi:hypothetical protein
MTVQCWVSRGQKWQRGELTCGYSEIKASREYVMAYSDGKTSGATCGISRRTS